MISRIWISIVIWVASFCVGIWIGKALMDIKTTATYYTAGSVTASGEAYNPTAMTCAAPSRIRFGSWLKIWTVGDAEEKVIYVQVNDRCKEGLDLTPTAFQKLAPLNRGRITIKYKIVD